GVQTCALPIFKEQKWHKNSHDNHVSSMKKTTIFQIRYQTVHRHLVPLQPKHQIWIPYWMKLMMSLKLMPKNSCRVLSKKVDSNSNQSLRANTELLTGKGPYAF